ncbi:RNA 2',3'-cyclic phosphodiesterase [Tessaracoccus sp. Y1736]
MFTAVLPPAGVIRQLDTLLEPRRDAEPSLRWTRPEGWHITTSFMGEVPEENLERLEENLAELAARTRPFDVELVGGIAFPDPARSRVLGLAAAAPDDRLALLSASCRAAASRAGVAADGARFVGHLTLARHNRGLLAVRWLEVFDSFPSWRWVADELCLVESHPGARYVVAERFPLGGKPTGPLD